MDRPIIVTGGAGFIGTHTVDLLLDHGHSVVVIDNLSHISWRDLNPAAELLPHDIASEPARDAIIRRRPAAILHLAAQGGVNRSWARPTIDAQINVVGTVAILEAAVAASCRRVVMASSGGALYGQADTLPTAEDAPTRPRSPYGTAKLAAEAYLGTFARIRGLSTLALRYGNVYGPGQDGTGEAGVVAISCERMLAGQPPVIRGDGSQTRDFVFVKDIARANVAALEGDAEGAVNIGSGRETPIAEVVTTLASVASFGDGVVHSELPPGEVARSALNPELAQRLLGWRADVSLREGLQETWTSFSNRETHPSGSSGQPALAR